MDVSQHSLSQSIRLHLYPGVLITLFFILTAPIVTTYGYPPQFALLLAVCLVVLPLLAGHLVLARRQLTNQQMLIPYQRPMRSGQYVGLVSGLVIWAFLVWGLTTPLMGWLSTKAFAWLPDWYTTQTFGGYSKQAIRATLVLNLVANGLLAPVAEELYFRGYLLPRIRHLERVGELRKVEGRANFVVAKLQRHDQTVGTTDRPSMGRNFGFF